MADLEKQDGSPKGSLKDKEGSHIQVVHPVKVDDSRYHFDEHDLDQVQRKLKQRHVQMIAIAGTIGTGLFMGSGGALASAGPLGALICYAIVGTVAYSSLCSVAEMTSWAPISGTFPHFAARWVDPAYGFAVGWNYWYTQAISVPVEITVTMLLLGFWDTGMTVNRAAGYTLLICFLVCIINILGVRYFGESEFVFSLIKITLIIALLLSGLIVDLGGGPTGERTGFRYWKNPGPLQGAGLVKNINTDRWIAIITTFVQAAFSFQGMELVAIAASETENPRRNISTAVKRVFYRILIFYILGILMIGMLVSKDDESLLQASGTAADSPFVIAFTRAGVSVWPHIINAGIFTSAFSASNSFLFCASRILYGLALRGQAPRFLAKCTKNGLPIYAVLASAAPSLLSFLNINSGAATVFNWFVNLTTVGGFITWFSINLTYIRFRRGMLAQGFDLKSNVYNNRFQPYIAYWGLTWTLFFILVNGIEVFFPDNWDTAGFLTSYLNLPIFAALFVSYKIIFRTKAWKPHEMDFITGIPTVEETEKPIEPPRTFGEKVAAVLF